jgi:hypothetical protein
VGASEHYQDFDMWSFSERHSVERLNFFKRRWQDPKQYLPVYTKQIIHVKSTNVAPDVSCGSVAPSEPSRAELFCAALPAPARAARPLGQALGA